MLLPPDVPVLADEDLPQILRDVQPLVVVFVIVGVATDAPLTQVVFDAVVPVLFVVAPLVGAEIPFLFHVIVPVHVIYNVAFALGHV